MRGASLLAAVGAFGLMGCAAVFRDSKTMVHVESDPPGGAVAMKEAAATLPTEVPVPRAGITEVRVSMPGYEEHHGLVRKHVNGWWVTLDLATCVVPVLLCVPLLVDAISGAWVDVEARYRARMVPVGMERGQAAYGEGGSVFVVRRGQASPARAPAPTAAASAQPTVVTPPVPTSTISDSERKASARAAYQEGVELQAQKSWAEALVRFQYAERTFDAPTHLLHIAQCLVATGKLVEAQETYETLTHHDLPRGAPEPFREAVDAGKHELSQLQPRIPTLRIQVRPAPSALTNLVILMNGRPLPNEVIGIARPVNPGAYRITATAWGIPPSKPIDVTLAETDATTVEVKLGR